MKKSTLIIVIVCAVLGILLLLGVNQYNTLVKTDENVNKAWGEVQTQYQRRLDLIPKLVEVVKASAAYESETLTKVIEARANATQITNTLKNVDASKLTAEQLEQFAQAQNELSTALLAIHEAYPELQAVDRYKKMMDELSGTENRIAVARNAYQEAVGLHNKQTRRFPAVLFAKMFGFSQRPYFSSQDGAEKAPEWHF